MFSRKQKRFAQPIPAVHPHSSFAPRPAVSGAPEQTPASHDSVSPIVKGVMAG